MVDNRTAVPLWNPRLLSRRSRLYAVIAGSFSLILLLIVAFFVENIREMREAGTFNAFLEAKGEVERLDEVLTMSAMAGAATGDRRWQERYDANVPLLDAALERALASGNAGAKRAIAATSDANNALIDLETRAFSLSRERRFGEALGLLQSDTYRDYKKKYAAGANEALAIIRSNLEWRSRVSVVVSAALGLIGIIVIGSASAIWKRVIDAQLEARSMLEKTETNLFKALGLAEAVVWEADLQTGAFSSPSDMSVFRGPGDGPGDCRADFWDRFLHPSDIGRVQAIWSKHLGAGAPLDMELSVRLSNGRSCWTRVVARTAADEAGRPVRAFGLLQNIDKRKSHEQQLVAQRMAAEAATIAKSQFLATMSHEIRTPMNGVLGMLDILLRSDLDETQRWPAKIACDSAHALLRILDDILDYSKIEAGQVEIEATNFNVRDVTNGVVSLLSPRGDEKGLAITSRIDDSLPDWVVGDPVRYRQILTNLLGNAIKFTEKGGVHMEASCTLEADVVELRVTVRDTGIGISRDAQERLFQRFTQADATTTRKFGGTGLGLAITKQLVELMGGSIHMESEAGKGCTFWFTLSVRTGAPPASTGNDTIDAADAGLALPPLRILLAEDNKVNQMIIRAFLKPGGHELVIVGDGSEALERVKTRPFDVVLMDVQMPVMDGLTATRAIRELPGDAAAVPIIALTANALAGDREEYLRAGMTDYLSKPVDSATLLRTIARVVANAVVRTEHHNGPLRGASHG
jgi:signal transduction histidine kinase/CheY-like chemotaxis protein